MRVAGRILGRRPSPAMVVAVIAVIAALSGSAAALVGRNSVTSEDIAPKAVKTNDLAAKAVKTSKLANGAVKAVKADLMRLATVPGEVTTTSSTAVDLGGPAVTVKVPKGGLVGILAEVEARMAGGGRAEVRLFEGTSVPTAPEIISTGSEVFDDRFTAPGPGNEGGAGGQLRGGWLVFSPGAGTHTFQLRYSRNGGAGTAIFRNRKLWVAVIS